MAVERGAERQQNQGRKARLARTACDAASDAGQEQEQEQKKARAGEIWKERPTVPDVIALSRAIKETDRRVTCSSG